MVGGLNTGDNERLLTRCTERHALLHYSDERAIPASQQLCYRETTVQGFTLFILSCFIPPLTYIPSKSKSADPILGTVSEKLPLTQCPYNQDRKSVIRKEGALCGLFPGTGNAETQDVISIFSKRRIFSQLLQSEPYN